MAQVIQRRSAANLIVSHARRTMSRASVSHEQIHQDAQQYLRKGVANAKQLTRDIEDKEEEVEDARSLIARAGLQLTRAAQAVRDDVFNKTERRAGDMLLNQIVPEGISQMLSFGAQRKVSFALNLATRFLTVEHPRISSDAAQGYADQLRAAVKPLQDAIAALAPLLTELAQLNTQYYATARALQIGLRNLKKHWMSQNMTATEVHEYIPDGRPEAADEDSASTTSTKGDSTEGDSGEEDDDGEASSSETAAGSGSTEAPSSSGST